MSHSGRCSLSTSASFCLYYDVARKYLVVILMTYAKLETNFDPMLGVVSIICHYYNPMH